MLKTVTIQTLHSFALLYAVLVSDTDLPHAIQSVLKQAPYIAVSTQDQELRLIVAKSYRVPDIEALYPTDVLIKTRDEITIPLNLITSKDGHTVTAYCKNLADKHNIFCYPHEGGYKAFVYHPDSDKVAFTVMGGFANLAIARAFVRLKRPDYSDSIEIPEDLFKD